MVLSTTRAFSALLQVHEEAPPDALGVAAALRAAEEALALEGAPARPGLGAIMHGRTHRSL